MIKTKIIGTGITGLVGSRIVELLQDQYDFVNFSLETGIDITNFDLLKKHFEQNDTAKVVLHLAGFTDVSAAWIQNGNKNGSCYQINTHGSRNIAQLCKKYSKYLIHISTDFVFDGQKKGKYNEDDRPNPIEWYGKTKLWAEQEVQKSECQSVILRIAFPYKCKNSDPSIEKKVKLDLVRNIKEKLSKGEELKMFEDQIITPTFIDDIAKAIDAAIKRKPKGIYHCTGSTNLSPYELALRIADVFKLDKSLIKKSKLEDFIKDNSDGRPRQKNLAMDNGKIQKDLGIEMLTLEEGLASCILSS